MQGKPQFAINYLRTKGCEVDDTMAKKVKSHMARQSDREAFEKKGVSMAQRYSSGAVAKAIEFAQRGNNTPGLHVLRVVGDYTSNSETSRLAVVLSTDNLLLNARRYELEGLNFTLTVDTTWSLVVEGHGTIVVGVVSPDQHFHAVSYGICSHDDAQAHQFVFEKTKAGVEEVVRKYARGGLQF